MSRVWQAITEPGTWRPGSRSGSPATGWQAPRSRSPTPQGRGPDFGGEVIACEPPSLLEFCWGPDLIRLEIAPRGAGCTLTLLDTFGELGKAARDAAGWHVCLESLASHLDLTPGPPGSLWAEVHPGYVTSFGPQASAIGVPAGYEPG